MSKTHKTIPIGDVNGDGQPDTVHVPLYGPNGQPVERNDGPRGQVRAEDLGLHHLLLGGDLVDVAA